MSLLNAYGLSQKHSEAYINPYWILLDSESSEHIFNNKELLEDIKSSTNGKSYVYILMGDISRLI